MPAHHAQRRPLVVANARHSPSYGCALRLDRTPLRARRSGTPEKLSGSESAAFGLPDSHYGEVVVAAIRLHPQVEAQQRQILDFIGERMARYKVPAHCWFVDSFPLTLSGKIQKTVLRDQFMAAHPAPSNAA